MRELQISNTDADATMETGVEERDSYYSNYAHHGRDASGTYMYM